MVLVSLGGGATGIGTFGRGGGISEHTFCGSQGRLVFDKLIPLLSSGSGKTRPLSYNVRQLLKTQPSPSCLLQGYKHSAGEP